MGLGVGVARLGVDVALITVQVEIVRAIDCASKCYASHLSTFFFFFPEQETSVPFAKRKKSVNGSRIVTDVLGPSHHMCVQLHCHFGEIK